MALKKSQSLVITPTVALIEPKHRVKYARKYGSGILSFRDEDTLLKRIEAYFSQCQESQKSVTINGFCDAIGITFKDLQTISNGNYSMLVSEFGEEKTKKIVQVLKKGYTKLAESFENTLLSKSQFQIGAIFLLKQLGMSDQPDKVTIKGAQNQPINIQIIKYSE